MPRHPKRKTPLRIFRETIGESQKSFSQTMHDLLGIAPLTYKAYEQGTRSLSETAAVRLMILYGVEPQSIMAKTGRPKDIAGRYYSRNSHKNWPGERVYDPDWLIRVIHRVTDRLIWMLLAARRANHFTLALHILDEAISQMQTELRLENHYADIADGGMPFEKWDSGRLYTAGGLIRQPERAEFPLATSAERAIKDLISEKKICSGKSFEDFIQKDDAFFSRKHRS